MDERKVQIAEWFRYTFLPSGNSPLFRRLLLAGVLIAYLSGFSAFVQRIRFYRETLEVTVLDDKTVEFSGTYCFANTLDRPVRREFRYPFPPELPMPTRIEILDSSGPVSHFPGEGKEIVFETEFAPMEKKWLQVRFLQSVPDRTFTYILSTSKSWIRPFETFDLSVSLPSGMRLAFCSLFPDFARGSERHSWALHGFMPQEDLTIAWRRVPVQEESP